jgi:hypothetical protein
VGSAIKDTGRLIDEMDWEPTMFLMAKFMKGNGTIISKVGKGQ